MSATSFFRRACPTRALRSSMLATVLFETTGVLRTQWASRARPERALLNARTTPCDAALHCVLAVLMKGLLLPLFHQSTLARPDDPSAKE